MYNVICCSGEEEKEGRNVTSLPIQPIGLKRENKQDEGTPRRPQGQKGCNKEKY
jgi:hypothetical protein